MPSTDLPELVATQWRRLSEPARRLHLGFSGGLDSTVLLHVLAGLREALGFSLSATHVSHGLVAGSVAWGEACAVLCTKLDVPFTQRDVIVSRRHPGGLEAAAREARRQALTEAGAGAVLVLAQHRDDQAETVLFRLLRGAGVKGAAGMHAFTTGASGSAVWRPLLDVPRSALREHALIHGLSWIEDPSNADISFSRNFLRARVLPVIESRFPGASRRLARSAGLMDEAAQLLDDLAERDLQDMPSTAGRHDLAQARALSSARLRNVLRHCLAVLGEPMPDENRLGEIERQFRAPGAAEGWRGVLGRHALCVYRSEWWFEAVGAGGDVGSVPAPRVWRREDALCWAGAPVQFEAVTGGGLDSRLLVGRQCELRSRQGGERMVLHEGGASRSLKNLLQEAGVPPWWRPALPLLWVDGRLAWVAGVGEAWEFRCPPGGEGVLPVWRRAG